ncbi:MAG: hypothetical protein ABH837_01005 [bacterium]
MPIKLDKDTVGGNIRTLPQIEDPVLTDEFLSWDDIQSIMKLVQKSNPGLYKLLVELSRDQHNGEKTTMLNSFLVLASEIARSMNGRGTTRKKLRKLS